MRYTDDFMESLRQVGDASLDPIMEELVSGKGLGAVNEALRHAVTNANAAPESLPTNLRVWLEEHACLPPGTDRARLERASAFFVDHAVSLSAILGLASLAECYAAVKGVKALHATDHTTTTLPRRCAISACDGADVGIAPEAPLAPWTC